MKIQCSKCGAFKNTRPDRYESLKKRLGGDEGVRTKYICAQCKRGAEPKEPAQQ